MKIKIKKTHPDAIVPEYQSTGAACFDLHAIGPKSPMDDGLTVRHNDPVKIRTGLAFEIPADHVMLVFSRSGHGFNNDVRLANCTGVIDSDYRGEVMVKLTNDAVGAGHLGEQALRLRSGDRIAQALVLPIERVEFDLVDELSTTERGAGGLGSTGA